MSEKMHKILILPDIHGREFWKEPCGNPEEYDKIVFLGDYLDPYPEEGIDREETIKNFRQIIKFKKKNLDKVVLLIGNHDEAYINSMMPKSRYDYKNSGKIGKLFDDNKKLFSLAYEEEINGKRYIFSHSGIEMPWIDDFKEMYEWEQPNDDNFVDFLNNNFLTSSDSSASILYMVSRYRGGWDSVGSCIWGDLQEFYNYAFSTTKRHLPNSYQIFGHTYIKEPLVMESFACLDCCKAFILEDGVVKGLNGEIIPVRGQFGSK